LTEGILKQQYRLIDPVVEKEFSGLPQSFQLVNYVCKDTSATTKIRIQVLLVLEDHLMICASKVLAS
jgi:hypothetical protein